VLHRLARAAGNRWTHRESIRSSARLSAGDGREQGIILALIRRFEPLGARDTGRVHGEVDCGFSIFENGGRRYLQLDTYGSSTRAIPGKVSQSIQVDEDGARVLARLVRQAFPTI